jgi:hypothetical protein
VFSFEIVIHTLFIANLQTSWVLNDPKYLHDHTPSISVLVASTAVTTTITVATVIALTTIVTLATVVIASAATTRAVFLTLIVDYVRVLGWCLRVNTGLVIVMIVISITLIPSIRIIIIVVIALVIRGLVVIVVFPVVVVVTIVIIMVVILPAIILRRVAVVLLVDNVG